MDGAARFRPSNEDDREGENQFGLGLVFLKLGHSFTSRREKGQNLHFAHLRLSFWSSLVARSQVFTKRFSWNGLLMFSRFESQGFDAVGRRFISAAITNFQVAPFASPEISPGSFLRHFENECFAPSSAKMSER